MRRKRSGLNFGRQRKKFNMPLFKEILSWIVELAIVIVMAYVIVSSFGCRTSVVGQAMESQLNNNDQILVNKFIYMLTRPKTGDVVVFLPNGNEKSHYYVRRVIGTPGDTVQIVNGAVYINGTLYNEDLDVAAIEDAGLAAEELTLGKDEYFVLGDNRNNSEDSRYANIGMVKKDYMLGKAWFYFSSIGHMGFIR
jgi:signal peptidase I